MGKALVTFAGYAVLLESVFYVVVSALLIQGNLSIEKHALGLHLLRASNNMFGGVGKTVTVLDQQLNAQLSQLLLQSTLRKVMAIRHGDIS